MTFVFRILRWQKPRLQALFVNHERDAEAELTQAGAPERYWCQMSEGRDPILMLEVWRRVVPLDGMSAGCGRGRLQHERGGAGILQPATANAGSQWCAQLT